MTEHHKHHQHHRHKKHKKIVLVSVIVGIAFIIGLVIAVVVFNLLERKKDNKFEVTFVTPRQAVVFWQTDTPSIGYVMYGDSQYNLTQKAEQTSSVPSTTHGVVIDDVPTNGLYLSVHTDADSRFYWPETKQILFDPTTIE